MVEEKKPVIPNFLIVGIVFCLILIILGTFFVSQSNLSAAWAYADKECKAQGWERAYTIEANWFSNLPSKYNCISDSNSEGLDLNV